MAIEGPLRELALGDVFQLLEISRKTGVLTVHADGLTRAASVRFDRGAIVGAEMPDERSRLGNLMLRVGKLSQIEMERVLREQRANPGIPFGTLAVRLGIANAADVKRQLAYQIEETVFALLRCKDGYFRFEEGSSQLDGILAVRLPTQSLLLEAARRTDEWAALSARIPHPEVVPVLEEVGIIATPLDLKPQEWEILAEIDGERTLKQIAVDLGRSDLDIARTVFDLLSHRVVAVVEEAPDEGLRQKVAGNGAPHQDLDRALSEGRRFLEHRQWDEAARSFALAVRLDPLDGAAHFYHGVAAARCGEFTRAENALRTFIRLPDGRGAAGDVARRALAAITALRGALDEVVA